MIQTRNLSGYHLVHRSIRTWYFTFTRLEIRPHRLSNYCINLLILRYLKQESVEKLTTSLFGDILIKIQTKSSTHLF